MVLSSPEAALSVPKRSIAIAALSTAIAWYDFTRDLYFAAVLAWCSSGRISARCLAAPGACAIADLMRQLGALAFAHLGDRRGRRPMPTRPIRQGKPAG